MRSDKPHSRLAYRPAIILTALALSLVAAGCRPVAGLGSASRNARAPLRVGLSSSLAAVGAQGLGLTKLGAAATVASDGSLLQSLAMGYVDAAIVWGLRPQLGEELAVEAIASDALAFVVHPSNQTGPLELEDLRALFAGRVSGWQAYGQALGSVEPVMRERGAGTRGLLEVVVLKGDLPASGASIAASDEAVLDYVASHPGAVGYVASANLREGVRALTVAGRRPEPQRVREGDYPIMGGIWFAYRPGSEAAVLLEPLLGEAGQESLGRWLAPPDWAPR